MLGLELSTCCNSDPLMQGIHNINFSLSLSSLLPPPSLPEDHHVEKVDCIGLSPCQP